MSEIVKICINCGPLKLDQIRIKSSDKSMRCKKCEFISAKKYQSINRDKLNALAREYRQKNIERLKVRDREWKRRDYHLNKDKYAARSKKFYLVNQNKRKNYRFQKLYGITLDQYNEMYKKQNGLCKICKKQETAINKNSGKIKDLAVDHCHSTGKVRGLLCGRCNCLIGYSLESIEILQEAISHIKEFKDDKQRE